MQLWRNESRLRHTNTPTSHSTDCWHSWVRHHQSELGLTEENHFEKQIDLWHPLKLKNLVSWLQWLPSQQVLLFRGVTESQCKDTQRWDTVQLDIGVLVLLTASYTLKWVVCDADLIITTNLGSDLEYKQMKHLKCLKWSISHLRDTMAQIYHLKQVSTQHFHPWIMCLWSHTRKNKQQQKGAFLTRTKHKCYLVTPFSSN